MSCLTLNLLNVEIPKIRGIPPFASGNLTKNEFNLTKNESNLTKNEPIIPNFFKSKNIISNFDNDIIEHANLNTLTITLPKNIISQDEITPRTALFSPESTIKTFNSITPEIVFTPSNDHIRQSSAPTNINSTKIDESKKIKFCNTSLLNPPILTRISTEETKIKKSKAKINVIYPIFEKCSMLTTDEFWIDLFTKASLGKFKRGFSFKDNYLISNKNKDKIYLDSDPVSAFNQCIYFFKIKAGIQSETDKIMDRKILESKIAETQKNIQYTWSDFKKNKTKELFINEYINVLVNKYNLNETEKLQLKHTINYGLVMGCFGSHNINFIDTHIENIEGLLYNRESKLFSISPQYPPKKRVISKSVKKSNVVPLFCGKYISITEKWNKFLQHFDDKSNKHNFNEKFEQSTSTLHSRVEHSNES